MMRSAAVAALMLASMAALATCSAQVPPASAAGGSTSARPHLVVHKGPTCPCCEGWIRHVQEAGFTVETREVADPAAVKDRLGVPVSQRSCHTAEVAGYFIEGHVPVSDIERLLAQRPDAAGLAAPGMPVGSPGMEMPYGETHAYDVHIVARDGRASVFSSHD
jgi:hypothetical protein